MQILEIIVVVVFVIALFGRFIFPLIMRGVLKVSEKNGIKCDKCKTKMQDVKSYLYLIPVHFDEQHEETAQYYITHARPIESTEQIPSGNRACRMYVFQCMECGSKKVSVVDFLRVRDFEMLKGGDIYPYEQFEQFLNSCEIK